MFSVILLRIRVLGAHVSLYDYSSSSWVQSYRIQIIHEDKDINSYWEVLMFRTVMWDHP